VQPFLLFDFFVFWIKNEMIEAEKLLLHCGSRHFYIVATRDWASGNRLRKMIFISNFNL